MAQKNYKIGEEIKVTYQAPGAATNETVIMEVYNELGELVVEDPNVPMVEVGNKGRYRKSFTPDAEGDWEVHIALDDGNGQQVKQYSVGGYHIDAVGTIVGETKAKLDEVENKIDELDSPAMIG